MVSNVKHVISWRKRTKERMVSAMGGKCSVCSYNKCVESLEFHHLDPNEKEFSFGSIRASPKSWKSIVEELKKCILVCSNCHKEIHAGITDVPDNFPSFDTKFEDYKLMEKLSKQTYCLCGKPKRDEAKYCSLSCSGKVRLKIDWSQYNLPLLNQTMTKTAMAKMIGVSECMIRKKLKETGSTSW